MALPSNCSSGCGGSADRTCPRRARSSSQETAGRHRAGALAVLRRAPRLAVLASPSPAHCTDRRGAYAAALSPLAAGLPRWPCSADAPARRTLLPGGRSCPPGCPCPPLPPACWTTPAAPAAASPHPSLQPRPSRDGGRPSGSPTTSTGFGRDELDKSDNNRTKSGRSISNECVEARTKRTTRAQTRPDRAGPAPPPGPAPPVPAQLPRPAQPRPSQPSRQPSPSGPGPAQPRPARPVTDWPGCRAGCSG
jgi:hypothetical protein